MSTTTTRTDALRERLAQLRQEEHQLWQAVLVAMPYSAAHVQAQGRWCETRGRIAEVTWMLKDQS